MIFINMNASLRLEQIIQEELEVILSEQRGAIFKQAPEKKFSADRIAKQIYDAKGTFVDDEESALKAIRQIKNIDQYQQVFSALKNMPDRLIDGGARPRNIAAYLKSFLSDSDRIQAAIHLYDVLPASHYNWTVKKLVSYDDLKSALSALVGRGSRYDELRFGDLPGRAINQIRKMFEDPAMYKNVAQQDAETEQDGFDASDILFRPFVSTEYYLKYKSLSAWINAPGGLRDMVYSPAGIGVTTAASLIPSPWTRVPNALLFAILTIDDISRIAQGDDIARLQIIWDSLGIIGGSGLAKIGKTIGSKFASLLAWVKNGGLLAKITRGMFNILIDIIESISKTPLGTILKSGAKAVNAIQSTVRSIISKSLSVIKNILIKLKNSMPEPIKKWAANALEALKSTSVEYYMSELKPIFDTMRLLAKLVKEIVTAPGAAIIDLARRLGVKSDWVVGVSRGANAAWIASIFNAALPPALSWWATYNINASASTIAKYKNKIYDSGLNSYFKDKTYTFIKRPGQSITIYSNSPGLDPEWINIGTKVIPAERDTKLPLLFIVNKTKSGYAQIMMPEQMIGMNEINRYWVKMTEIIKTQPK